MEDLTVVLEFPSGMCLIKCKGDMFWDAHGATYRGVLAHKTEMFKCDQGGDALKVFREELAGDIFCAKTFDKVESSRH